MVFAFDGDSTITRVFFLGAADIFPPVAMCIPRMVDLFDVPPFSDSMQSQSLHAPTANLQVHDAVTNYNTKKQAVKHFLIFIFS